MKKILSLCCFLALLVGCMDHHDEPTEYVYGNPSIGEPNITISELKDRYQSIIGNNKSEQITENLIIQGVVTGDDESGNIYKQIYIADETDGIVVGINMTGIYAYCPVGQKIVLNCKDLYIGGYGKMAQIGTLYEGKVGRMSEAQWKSNVRFVGSPNLSQPELKPLEIDENYLKTTDQSVTPQLIKLNNVVFTEADGETLYAPEEMGDGDINRNLKVGNTNVIFRVSTYSNFANDVIPEGNVQVTGLLTRYNDSWQIKVRTGRDITKTND